MRFVWGFRHGVFRALGAIESCKNKVGTTRMRLKTCRSCFFLENMHSWSHLRNSIPVFELNSPAMSFRYCSILYLCFFSESRHVCAVPYSKVNGQSATFCSCAKDFRKWIHFSLFVIFKICICSKERGGFLSQAQKFEKTCNGQRWSSVNFTWCWKRRQHRVRYIQTELFCAFIIILKMIPIASHASDQYCCVANPVVQCEAPSRASKSHCIRSLQKSQTI